LPYGAHTFSVFQADQAVIGGFYLKQDKGLAS